MKQNSGRDNSLGSASQATFSNMPSIHVPIGASRSQDLHSQSYTEGSPMRHQDNVASSPIVTSSSLPNPSPGSSFTNTGFSKGLSPNRQVRYYNEGNNSITTIQSASYQSSMLPPPPLVSIIAESPQPTSHVSSLPPLYPSAMTTTTTTTTSNTSNLSIFTNQYELQHEPSTSSPESETAAPESESSQGSQQSNSNVNGQVNYMMQSSLLGPEEGRFYIGSYEQSNMNDHQNFVEAMHSQPHQIQQPVPMVMAPNPLFPRPTRHHVVGRNIPQFDRFNYTNSSDSDNSANPSSYPQTFGNQLYGYTMSNRSNLASPNSQNSSVASSPFIFPTGHPLPGNSTITTTTTTYYYSSPNLLMSSSPHPNTNTALLAPNRLVHSSSANGILSAKSLTPDRREAAQEAIRLRESLRNHRQFSQFSPSPQQSLDQVNSYDHHHMASST